MRFMFDSERSDDPGPTITRGQAITLALIAIALGLVTIACCSIGFVIAL